MRFLGHRRWLWATAYVFTLSTSIVRFLVRALGGQAGVNPYRGCTLSGVAVQSPQPPDANCMEPRVASVQRLRGDGAVTVAPQCRFWACGLRAVPVRGLVPDTTYDMSTGYGLTIFQIGKTFPLNKRPRSPWIRTKISQPPPASAWRPRRGRTERGIRAGYGLRRPIAGQMWTTCRHKTYWLSNKFLNWNSLSMKISNICR